MFNDSRSFYYSPNGDITNSNQRQARFQCEKYDWRKVSNELCFLTSLSIVSVYRTLYCMMSTNMSYKLKQTCSF